MADGTLAALAKRETDGGPAFPIPLDNRPGAYEAHPGMSLRDYFAGQVIEGVIADVHPFKIEVEKYAKIAHMAYALADAMLKARDAGGA